MPPKSKAESKAPESTASRRSARLAGSAAPESEVKETKKRAVSAPKSDTKSKKAKTTSKSNGKKEEPITEEEEPKENSKDDEKDEEEKAKEEKKEEAPKSAKSDSSSKILKVGDKLPNITLQDEKGDDVKVADLTKDGKGVVIFLYPKADTPGCTTQACGFRDHYDEIKDLGYDIYGLSKDKPAAQQKWITKKSLTYTLLSDPESRFIKKLGAFVQPNNTKRSHFIFSKDDGKLVDIALGVKPADDPSNVIKFLKNHHK